MVEAGVSIPEEGWCEQEEDYRVEVGGTCVEG